MKAAEPRKVRGYKVTDKAYTKAMRKAPQYGTHLASILEGVVIAFGEGNVNGIEVEYYINQTRKKKAK